MNNSLQIFNPHFVLFTNGSVNQAKHMCNLLVTKHYIHDKAVQCQTLAWAMKYLQFIMDENHTYMSNMKTLRHFPLGIQLTNLCS